MPAARMAGSGFADVSEETQSRGWIRPSPHSWGTAEQRGWGLRPRLSEEGDKVRLETAVWSYHVMKPGVPTGLGSSPLLYLLLQLALLILHVKPKAPLCDLIQFPSLAVFLSPTFNPRGFSTPGTHHILPGSFGKFLRASPLLANWIRPRQICILEKLLQ